jgi:teichuronic acid exporter
VGRPEVTLWTQLASLCLTPIGVLIGVNWGIEGIAVSYVLCQLIAVEIPMFILVLSEMRVSPRTLADRLVGVTAATSVMATACVIGREALTALGVGMAERAALTVALGTLVYALALWWLAPRVSRRVLEICRRRLRGAINALRRPALQP